MLAPYTIPYVRGGHVTEDTSSESPDSEIGWPAPFLVAFSFPSAVTRYKWRLVLLGIVGRAPSKVFPNIQIILPTIWLVLINCMNTMT